MTKIIFSHEELEKAIIEMWRLRLVEGWGGHLKLEANKKELMISQFLSDKSWTKGYKTIYRIHETDDWGDLIGNAYGDARELRLPVDEFEGQPFKSLVGAKIDKFDYVLTGEKIAEFFNELGLQIIISKSIEITQKRLNFIKKYGVYA